MTDEELRQLFEGIRQENAAAHEETRRLSNVTAEGLRQEIRLVGESVLQIDKKLDRTAQEIRAEMRQGFAETQAMIKFSYAELDRRVSSLEERVDRLEAAKPH